VGGSNDRFDEGQMRVVQFRDDHLADAEHLALVRGRERDHVRETGLVAKRDRGCLDRPERRVRPAVGVALLAGRPERAKLLVVVYVDLAHPHGA